MDLADLLADLDAESADADRLVADLPADRWQLATPSPGWTIAHQVGHLAWTDQAALLAITDPDAFNAHLTKAVTDPAGFVDAGATQSLAEPDVMLRRWRAGRADLVRALGSVPAGAKIAWYGTAMAAPSLATARLMETWAHGLDIADALGVVRPSTHRLRHIAHLGHRTLGFAFLAHGRELPTDPVFLALTGPEGTQWTFGPADAANRVDGSALDFCLLVTQRRNRDNLDLVASGPVADAWLDVAQAFAGPPGSGREKTEAAHRETAGEES